MKTILLLISTLILSHQAWGAMKPSLTLKPNPPDVGDNSVEITLTDEQNKPVEGASVALVISMPAMGSMPYMEEKAAIKPLGQGKYLAEYTISMGGSWEVALILKKDSQEAKFNYSLTTQIPGLVSKNAVSTSSSANMLSIGPERLQKIGVRFSEVKKASLTKNLRAVGVVEADPSKKSDLVLRFSGYVGTQLTGKVGDFVEKGTPLFTVYSPDLVAAQNEFFLSHSEGNHNLHNITFDRLKNLGLSDKDIAGISESGKPQRDVTITAPSSGTILDINVREGSGFTKNQTLYSIGNLNQFFIVARIFQKDLPNIKPGQVVELSMPGFTQETYPGKVDLIYPNTKEGEGTASVRITTDAKSLQMIPGAYVDLNFPIDFGSKLIIPITAILHSGLHQYVFIDRGEGTLEPREIMTGNSTEDMVEVLSGLKEGERVAASGTFLLSSEAQLRSALPKWEAKK